MNKNTFFHHALAFINSLISQRLVILSRNAGKNGITCTQTVNLQERLRNVASDISMANFIINNAGIIRQLPASHHKATNEKINRMIDKAQEIISDHKERQTIRHDAIWEHYNNTGCTLNELCQTFDISISYVREILNKRLQQNFTQTKLPIS